MTPELTPATTAIDGAAAAGKKRGRPRKPETIIVNVRMPTAIYDRYCRCALRSRQSVRGVLRHVLTLHAPSP